MQLTGIEIAPEAIACAKQSAAELGLTRLQFQALDSTQFATAQGEVPELVLVNPPRRGIGKPLCDYLSTMAPRFIIYSSCNAQTMAKDIRELPGYRIERVQLSTCSPHRALRSADTAGKNVNTSLKSISLRHTSILNNNRDRSININRSIMVIYCAIFANQITNNQIRSLNELF